MAKTKWEKHILTSQIIEGQVNHDTVTLMTAYHLLSDKFCAFSVLDLLWVLTEGFVSFFKFHVQVCLSYKLKFVEMNTEVSQFTTGLEKGFVKNFLFEVTFIFCFMFTSFPLL